MKNEMKGCEAQRKSGIIQYNKRLLLQLRLLWKAAVFFFNNWMTNMADKSIIEKTRNRWKIIWINMASLSAIIGFGVPAFLNKMILNDVEKSKSDNQGL